MPDWINTLPPQIYWPTLVVAALTYFWPHLRSIWRDLLPRHRQFQRERERLELLKLWYEVEAAREKAGIGDAGQPPDYLSTATEPGPSAASERGAVGGPEPEQAVELPRRRRIHWAVAGALTICLLTFIAGDLSFAANREYNILIFVGIGLRYLAFVGFAAGLALIVRSSDAKSAFVVGMVPALLLNTLILISSQLAEPARNPGPMGIYDSSGSPAVALASR